MGLLYLKGIQLKELKVVLDFAYHGEVKIAQDSLDNFLAVAEELAVKGLTTNVKPSDQISKKAVSAKKKRTITQEKNSNLKATKKTKLSHSFDLEESDEDKVNSDAKNETIKSEPKYLDPDFHADKNIEKVEVDI